MSKAVVFLADGFEECEGLLAVDLLRRAGCAVDTASISKQRQIISSHGVCLMADALADEVDFSDVDMIVLPGGMPGTTNLYLHAGLRDLLKKHAAEGKLIAAICAAPSVLARHGLLNGYKASCYPSFEPLMKGAVVTGQMVTEDRNIITGEGPAAALPFAFTILRRFISEDEVKAIEESMRFTHLMHQ